MATAELNDVGQFYRNQQDVDNGTPLPARVIGINGSLDQVSLITITDPPFPYGPTISGFDYTLNASAVPVVLATQPAAYSFSLTGTDTNQNSAIEGTSLLAANALSVGLGAAAMSAELADALIVLPVTSFQGDGDYIGPTSIATPNQGAVEIGRNDTTFFSGYVPRLVGRVSVEYTDVNHPNGPMDFAVFGMVHGIDAVFLGSGSTPGDGQRTILQIQLADPGLPGPPIGTLFPGELIVRCDTGSRNGDYFVHHIQCDPSVAPSPAAPLALTSMTYANTPALAASMVSQVQGAIPGEMDTLAAMNASYALVAASFAALSKVPGDE